MLKFWIVDVETTKFIETVRRETLFFSLLDHS